MNRIIIAAIVVAFFLYGCDHQIPLNQSADDIIQIELINNEDILCTLSDTDITQFMNALMELECHKNIEPVGDCGYLQVHIYYENGDIDIIGCDADGEIKDGELIISGWYYFKEYDLLELFNSFTDHKAG